MKKLFIAALSVMLIGSTYAESEKKIKTEIDDVTVFLQGAQIHRSGKVSLPKGVTKVIIEGMPQGFNKNSIQVKGRGEFIIMDVSSKLFYPVPEESTVTTEVPEKVLREIRFLQDSLNDLSWKLADVDNDIQSYSSEKQILLNSGVIKGQASNDSIPALKDAMDYLRVKLADINGLLLKSQRKKSDLTMDQTRMSNRLSELNNYSANQRNLNQQVKPMDPVQQVIVTVSADDATAGYLELNYMVYDAGWSPAYDLRADDITSPVKLTYKANVFQNTGVNWDNVNVKLSTINPNRSNVKPVLAPWYVDFYRPVQTPIYSGNAYAQPKKDDGYDLEEVAESAPNSMRAANNKEYASKLSEAKQISNFTTMSENMAMVEFDLKLKQSIPSDGQYHMMAVKSENIKSSYEHFIVPKLDKDAFLIAHLTGWEEMNLLPAVANIYYDGTYVGQTRINPSVMSDTLDLSLGRDNGIYVTRKKTDDDEKIKALSNEKIKTVTYEIAIKNYKAGSINLTIEDQLPITTNEDIKVELLTSSKAEYNNDDGMLIWKYDIGAKETKKLSFSYSMKYHKDKQLAANY